MEKVLPVTGESLAKGLNETLALSCGTKGMNQVVLQSFADIGIPIDDIFKL